MLENVVSVLLPVFFLLAPLGTIVAAMFFREASL